MLTPVLSVRFDRFPFLSITMINLLTESRLLAWKWWWTEQTKLKCVVPTLADDDRVCGDFNSSLSSRACDEARICRWSLRWAVQTQPQHITDTMPALLIARHPGAFHVFRCFLGLVRWSHEGEHLIVRQCGFRQLGYIDSWPDLNIKSVSGSDCEAFCAWCDSFWQSGYVAAYILTINLQLEQDFWFFRRTGNKIKPRLKNSQKMMVNTCKDTNIYQVSHSLQ